ncbi:MAG: gamma-glutamyltransferase [Candidatus Omnitrophota bacterium]|jgi:gamma-glutamyltranspeptidase/glutathione hydrolase|nr:MAG: gamma-glutamyltransferase [Candidatus Omnitrophota bacterium]
MNCKRSFLGFIVLSSFSSFCFADFKPVYAKHGMVVSAEDHATRVGVDILERGGNAFDAATAVGFALAVTYPSAGNIGGGGFMIALRGKEEPIFLDFREKAPQAAARDMFLDADGNVIDGLSLRSMLAVGVPGTVDGLLRIQEDYGKLSRREVMEPAIRLAEEGFPVSFSLAGSLQGKKTQELLTRFDSTRTIFYPDDQPLAAGSILLQADLAKTLRLIREKGAQGFYEGETADRFVQFMKKQGGIITQDDLKNYKSIYRTPFIFCYKNYELITPAAPSSGGVTLAQILKLIEPFPLQTMGYHSANAIQKIIEAERLAFADRNYFLGDPDFVHVPDRELISPRYIESRRKRMPKANAGKSDKVNHGSMESPETTHYCVVDQDRNVVAITYTLNGSYGVGAVVEGAGFLLNNEMDDFSAKPGAPNMFGLTGAEANAVAPGKRMLSSMTPTIVLKDGLFAFTIGSPGGATIITTNVQVFLNIAEFGMNIREAIDARRFHHQWLPDMVDYEPFAFSPDTFEKLIRKGYPLKRTNSIGLAEGIQAMKGGLLAGYSDGRGTGSARGY